jgi:hypothetical protein
VKELGTDTLEFNVILTATTDHATDTLEFNAILTATTDHATDTLEFNIILRATQILPQIPLSSMLSSQQHIDSSLSVSFPLQILSSICTSPKGSKLSECHGEGR